VCSLSFGNSSSHEAVRVLGLSLPCN
jgi:hypothetical protein